MVFISLLFCLCVHAVPYSGKQHMGAAERRDLAHGNLSLFSSQKLGRSSSKECCPWFSVCSLYQQLLDTRFQLREVRCSQAGVEGLCDVTLLRERDRNPFPGSLHCNNTISSLVPTGSPSPFSVLPPQVFLASKNTYVAVFMDSQLFITHTVALERPR